MKDQWRLKQPAAILIRHFQIGTGMRYDAAGRTAGGGVQTLGTKIYFKPTATLHTNLNQLGAPQAEVYRLGPGDWWAAAISVPPTAAALDWVLSDAAQRVWDNNGMRARPQPPSRQAMAGTVRLSQRGHLGQETGIRCSGRVCIVGLTRSTVWARHNAHWSHAGLPHSGGGRAVGAGVRGAPVPGDGG